MWNKFASQSSLYYVNGLLQSLVRHQMILARSLVGGKGIKADGLYFESKEYALDKLAVLNAHSGPNWSLKEVLEKPQYQSIRKVLQCDDSTKMVTNTERLQEKLCKQVEMDEKHAYLQV